MPTLSCGTPVPCPQQAWSPCHGRFGMEGENPCPAFFATYLHIFPVSPSAPGWVEGT